MKKMMTTTLAILVFAAGLQMTANADDPINPVQGAVCNLYDVDDVDWADGYWDKGWQTVSTWPAVATFVDTASDFTARAKKDGIDSDAGMWTGWIKQECAGTYTFVFQQKENQKINFYGMWINNREIFKVASEQTSINVDLEAGFNSVVIIVSAWPDKCPLTITYKKAGSLEDPVPLGPGDMFHDDEED